MDRLDVGTTPLTRAALETEEQATAWLFKLVDEMKAWRAACDVQVPQNNNVAVMVQKRTFWTFLTKQGQVTGAAMALRHVGLISDRCFDEANQLALNALISSHVGTV